jgi:hypothetical protein
MRTLVHAQQRRSVRRALDVECRVVRERDSRVIARRSVDLSPQGMLVVTDVPILTGEPLWVIFRLPRSDAWMGAEATVARVVHGRRPGDPGRCVGVEFDALDQGSARYLRHVLRRVPPPLPMREPRVDYAATVHLAALS